MAQAKLQISIISAHNLYNADGFLAGKSDPYVICEVPGQPEMRFKTPVINNNLNPVWNHVGEIAGFMHGDTLEFQVWDSDTFPKPDQLLGKAMLTAEDFYPQGIEGPLQLLESKSADAMLTVRVIVLETTDPQDPNMMQQEGVEYQQQVEYTQDGMMIQQEQMIPQQAFSGPQTLHVNVISARGLYNADGFLAGKSDPYCICLIPEKKHNKFTTKTISNCLDPDWNHTGLIHDFEAGDSLEFQVWDKDTFPKPDQLLGKVTLSPQDFDNNPGGIEGQLPLSGGLSKDCGMLEVRIVVDAAATIEDAQQAAAQEAAHSHHGGASATHTAAGAVQPGVKRLSVGSQHLDKLAGAKMAKLKITVFSAKGLYNSDGFLAGKSDPYVLCHVPENKLQKFKTKVLGNTLDPTWNHLGVINGFVVGHTLELIVYDSDTPPKPDQQLGKVVLNSDDFFPYGLEGTLVLAESKAADATLSVRIEVMPDTKDTGLAGARPGVHTGATYQMQYGQPVRPAPVYYQQQQVAGGLSGSIQYVSGGAYTTGQTYTYSTAASVPVAQTAFDAIDANHDGVITRTEFASAMAEPVAAQPIATKVEYASTPVIYTTAAAQPQVVTYAAQPMPATTTVTMPLQQEPVVGATYTTAAASPVAATSQEISYVTMAPAAAPAQPVVSSTVAASPMTTMAPSTTYTMAPTTMAPTTIAAPAASTAVSYVQAAPAPAVMPATTVTMPPVAAPAQPVASVTMAPTTVTMPQQTAAVASSVVMQPQPVVQAASASIAAAGTTVAPAVTIASQPTTITSQPAAASYRVSGTPATLGAATYAAAAPATTVTAPAMTVQPMMTYAAAPTTTVGAPATTYTAAPTYMTSGTVQGARVSYGAPTYTMAPATYAAPGAVTTVAAGSAGLFDRLDKNHDGVLSKTEFAAALR